MFEGSLKGKNISASVMFRKLILGYGLTVFSHASNMKSCAKK